MSKKIVRILLVLALIAGIGSLIFYKYIKKPEPTEVEMAKVEPRTIKEKVNASGTIEPDIYVEISPDVSGEITEILVEKGQQVRIGDPLIRIRPDNYLSMADRADATLQGQKSAEKQSLAQLAQARVRLAKAKIDYNQNSTLFKQNVISRAEFEVYNAAYLGAEQDVIAITQSVESARFNIKSAAANLKDAKENLRKTTIYAPLTGTVVDIKVEAGQRVVGTSQMAGTPILYIGQLEKMLVKVNVNENDILKISQGDSVDVFVDSYTDRTFLATVQEIANIQNKKLTNDAVTEYEVKILLSKPSYSDLETSGKTSPFKIGMTATVEITTEVKKGVLAVPLAAVQMKRDSSEGASGSKEMVYIIKNGKAEEKIVTTGIADFEHIELKTGLANGDEIIAGPYSLISKADLAGKDVKMKEDKEPKETTKGK